MRADPDAVAAGLTLPWSAGAGEGHGNRIKMLKRQMYGRAQRVPSGFRAVSQAELSVPGGVWAYGETP